MRLRTTVSQADWDVVRSNYSAHESGDGAKLIRFVERIAERLEMEKDSSHPDSASKQAWSDLSKIYEENIDLVTEAMFVLVTYWDEGTWFFESVLTTVERFYLVQLIQQRVAEYESLSRQGEV